MNRKRNLARWFSDAAAAGLPGAAHDVEDRLRRAGVDPDRLSIFHLGAPARLIEQAPGWLARMLLGYLLWGAHYAAGRLGVALSDEISMVLQLVCGLVILQASCQALLLGTTRMAAKRRWNHYMAGTLSEILSTLPELVVIAFVVTVSAEAAFLIAMVTIYNNALVFSLYSFFLPKNKRGKFVMPEPITDAGTQILIAGASLGLVIGIVMLVFSASTHPKSSFHSGDLAFISVLMLTIFAVYIYKLLHNYAAEEREVQETLALDTRQRLRRRLLVYRHVKRVHVSAISAMMAAGVAGAFLGGHVVAESAKIALRDLGLNPVLTAIVLAGFAGLSEYVIIWHSHRKQEYGIALANAFGGITQVMFLILPFTLLCIAVYQHWFAASGGDWLVFNVPNILLLVFLYPTFYTLSALLEEDHTFDVLDTTIMTGIVVLLMILLIAYSVG